VSIEEKLAALAAQQEADRPDEAQQAVPQTAPRSQEAPAPAPATRTPEPAAPVTDWGQQFSSRVEEDAPGAPAFVDEPSGGNLPALVDFGGAADSTDLAEEGFLGWLNSTFGFFHFPRTAAELERDGWKRDMNVKVHPAKSIAMVSGNGSTGKSAMTQLLGDTLTVNRAEKGVCAVDCDASSILARRMRPNNRETERRSVATFIRDVRAGLVESESAVGNYLVTNKEGFRVLPGVGYTGDAFLDPEDLPTVLDVLSVYQKLIFLDMPGAREAPIVDPTLGRADAMVLVADTNQSSLSSSYHMLQQINQNHEELRDNTIVLLNNRSGGRVTVDLDEATKTMCRLLGAQSPEGRVFTVGFDPHVAESGPIEIEKCTENTRRDFEEIAAALMNVVPVTAEPRFRSSRR
jgi:MinD-like ATPase involved in chromosome partitioning or flagellar assembly